MSRIGESSGVIVDEFIKETEENFDDLEKSFSSSVIVQPLGSTSSDEVSRRVLSPYLAPLRTIIRAKHGLHQRFRSEVDICSNKAHSASNYIFFSNQSYSTI